MRLLRRAPRQHSLDRDSLSAGAMARVILLWRERRTSLMAKPGLLGSKGIRSRTRCHLTYRSIFLEPFLSSKATRYLLLRSTPRRVPQTKQHCSSSLTSIDASMDMVAAQRRVCLRTGTERTSDGTAAEASAGAQDERQRALIDGPRKCGVNA